MTENLDEYMEEDEEDFEEEDVELDENVEGKEMEYKLYSKGENEESMEELPKALFDFEVARFQPRTSILGRESIASIVNAKKNGIRITFSRKHVLDKLGAGATIQVAYSKELEGIILGRKLGGTDYTLKVSHGKGVVYNKDLVEYLSAMLKLDFSEKTTHSFYDVKFMLHERCGKVAVIRKGDDV